MSRLIIAATVLACLAGPSLAQEKVAPEGLVCPAEIAGGELISVAGAGPTPGVTGYCVYYLVGETDFEAVTMTLRAADAAYDWQASFKAPKIEKGGMTPVAETVEIVPFGDGEKPATLISLRVAEEDLGPITESFSTLWVFDLGNGRVVSLEEEYNNLSEGMRGPLREALLRAQEG